MCNFIKLLNDLKKITMRKKVKGKEKKSWEISKFWWNKVCRPIQFFNQNDTILIFLKINQIYFCFFFLKDKQYCFDKEKNQIEIKLGLD